MFSIFFPIKYTYICSEQCGVVIRDKKKKEQTPHKYRFSMVLCVYNSDTPTTVVVDRIKKIIHTYTTVNGLTIISCGKWNSARNNRMEMKMKTIQLPCLIYYLVALISINAIEREFDGNATIKASNEITTKENIKKKV